MKARHGLIACLVLAACESEPPAGPAESSHLHLSASLTTDDLLTLRQVTAPLHNIKQARARGWSERITDCFKSPDGGMGFHFGNPGLIDGRVAVDEPELLVYEPQKNGGLKLVAVEYIVPRPLWTESELPKLHGQVFASNDGFDLYTLHVWLWQENPSGIFADWNPTVSCQFENEVE